MSFLAHAQFNKGSIILGGQLSFSTNSTVESPGSAPNEKSNVGTFDISVGKAIRENAIFGLQAFYGFSNDGNVAPYYANHSYGIGIFYRKYKDLGKEFFLFAQAGAGYSGDTQSGVDTSGNKVNQGTTNGGQIYIYPGIAYRISKKFFLELTIPELFEADYSSVKSINPQQTLVTNQFNISTSLSDNPLNSLAIGFRLVL